MQDLNFSSLSKQKSKKKFKYYGLAQSNSTIINSIKNPKEWFKEADRQRKCK